MTKNNQSQPEPGELKYCKEHRTIHCSCQQREIDRLEAENKCYKAMKEGVEIRIGDQQAEIERLQKAVGLLNSMVNGRESHSEQSKKVVEQALQGDS